MGGGGGGGDREKVIRITQRTIQSLSIYIIFFVIEVNLARESNGCTVHL